MSERQEISDQHVENMFFTLLGDAIETALLLPGLKAPGTKLRYARFSVLSSALAIEAAANSCFERVSFPPAVLKKIERNLGTMDKYDMFSLELFKNSRFDRGCLAAQRIEDLLAVRNDYVHPKITPRPAVGHNEAVGQVTIYCGTYDHLKIEKSPRAWTDSTPLLVLKAVDDFLTNYFLENAKMSPASATEILIPQMLMSGRKMPASIDLQADILYIDSARANLKIPFRFVDNNTALGKPS